MATPVSPSDPARDAVAITPDNAADLARACRGILVGVAGNVKITTLDGTDVVLPSLAAGVCHPIAAKRIFATGTTASSIVALY